ncbi:MAG: hypothetical protein AAGI71_02605 [Bacteroidota bacterium]
MTNTDQPLLHSQQMNIFFNGRYTEFFVAQVIPGRGTLSTIEFFEDRADLGEVSRLKQVDWEIPVPDSVQLFMPHSVVLRNDLNAFWTGWVTNETIQAVSIYQERPIEAIRPPDDHLVEPALVLPDQSLHYYFWQPEAGAWALWRHVFEGPLGQPGRVRQERLLQTASRPLYTAAALAPTTEAFPDVPQPVIGWLRQEGESFRVEVARIHNDGMVAQDQSISFMATLFEDQQLALLSIPDGQVHAACIVVSDAGLYYTHQFVFDFEEETPTALKGGRLFAEHSWEAVRMHYYPSVVDAELFVVALDSEQTLVLGKPDSDFVQVWRSEVEEDYAFPWLISPGDRYEARYEHGEIILGDTHVHE